jgi:translation factor GUF1, mitochondrial
VSRSIRACEGAILVVDATKGIQAQTISNFYKAFDANLTIIPVINKIELPAAEVKEVTAQLVTQLDFKEDEIMLISAKQGLGVPELFEAIVNRISPPPKTEKDLALKCFLFDARFVPSRGVACLIKVMQGTFDIEKVRQLMSYHKGKRYEVYEVGVVQPELSPTRIIKQG